MWDGARPVTRPLVSTAYWSVPTEAIPGVFKVGGQWRVSVGRFPAEVHGSSNDGAAAV